jgi:hypothetical protein
MTRLDAERPFILAGCLTTSPKVFAGEWSES